MTEQPPKRPSALEALRRYETEADLIADRESQPALDQQLRQDLEGSLASGGEPPGGAGETPPGGAGETPAGPAPEARPLLRELAFEPGVALCLSGFGYKGILFNAGSLIRLNEFGMLPRLDRILSVSGGSVVAAVLGRGWPRLDFDSGVARGLDEHVTAPLRRLAGTTIDVSAGLLATFSRRTLLPRKLEEHLFGGATLQDLPERPKIIIGATNLQSGALWRFSRAYMGDWRVGQVREPRLPLAIAVAASAAYSPLLSPIELELDESQYTPGSGADLQHPPFTTKVQLVDGSVYDSLALEGAWERYRTILVSDGAGGVRPDSAPGSGRGPAGWVGTTLRVEQLAQHQVRTLYKRQLINAFAADAREGAYWGLRTDIAGYGLPDALGVPNERAMVLADTPSRYAELDSATQERLINLGYALADAAVRRHLPPEVTPPPAFPYPAAAI